MWVQWVWGALPWPRRPATAAGGGGSSGKARIWHGRLRVSSARHACPRFPPAAGGHDARLPFDGPPGMRAGLRMHCSREPSCIPRKRNPSKSASNPVNDHRHQPQNTRARAAADFCLLVKLPQAPIATGHGPRRARAAYVMISKPARRLPLPPT